MSKPPNNPYAAAAGAYDQNAQAHTPDQRELEGRVLLKAARMMTELQKDWENSTPDLIEATLKYNRQVWMLFYDTALENKDGGRPNDLRSNIVNLANFIFKRELDILADPKPQKIDILLNINREIAAGLMVNNQAAAPPTSSDTQQQPTKSTTDISG